MRAGRAMNMMCGFRPCNCRRECIDVIAQDEGNATRSGVLRFDFGLFLSNSSETGALDGSESFFLLCLEPVSAGTPSTKPRGENSK
jgi:hypothetical protein